MNSRQVNFYLTTADMAELERRLRQAEDFLIIESPTAEPEPRVRESTRFESMGKDNLDLFLVRAVDLPHVRLKKVPGRPYRVVDTLTSPVIEFSRCYETPDLIRRGRMYFVTKYYDSTDELVSKDAAFIAWADKLLKVARRTLKKEADSFYYFGPEAEQRKAAGVEMPQI